MTALGQYAAAVPALRRALQLQPRLTYLPLDIRSEYGAQADFSAHLDALAGDGVAFRNHFSVCAPCGPARASLLTGMYMQNHRSVMNGMVDITFRATPATAWPEIAGAGATSFYNLDIDKFSASDEVHLDKAITVSNDFDLTQGILDVTSNDYSITLGGNWLHTAGTFIPRNGTVILNSATTPVTVNGAVNTSFNN
ncbi:MAG: sulfatase-like hydrolase/transferase, partial [Planctomycetes bacterium]|nr:sulfatase-like hydrolase/transferase [Planctomycetota bacterium]